MPSLQDVLDPEPPQDDCDSGGDASDDEAQPTRLAGVPDCVGIMTQRDWSDAFVFHAEAGQWVEVSLTPDSTYPYMSACVQGPQGAGGCFQVNYPDIREAFEMPVAGDVRVSVSWGGGRDMQFDYRFRAWRSGETPDAPQDDCGLGRGASNWYATADHLATPAACAGTLAGEDAWDWYSFDALLGQDIEVWLDVGRWVDHEVCLYDPWGALAGCGTLPAGHDDHVNVSAHLRGSWLVVVYRYSGDGAYGLHVNVTGEPANEAPGASLSCPWLVEVGTPVTCTGSGRDFESSRLQYEVRWDGGAWEPLGEFDAGETVTVSRVFDTPDEGVYAALRVTDEGGLAAVAVSWSYIHPAAGPQDDCGAGVDAGSTRETAVTLGASAICRGSLRASDFSDPVDVYAVDIPAGGGLLRASDVSGELDGVCIRDAAGEDRECGWTVAELAVTEGRWYVVVDASYTDLNYTLGITTRSFEETGDALVPTVSGSVPMALSDLPVPVDLDGFEVELPVVATGAEAIRVTGGTGWYHVRFYDTDGAFLGSGGGYADTAWGESVRFPPGATRALVQREVPTWPDEVGPALTAIVFW